MCLAKTTKGIRCQKSNIAGEKFCSLHLKKDGARQIKPKYTLIYGTGGSNQDGVNSIETKTKKELTKLLDDYEIAKNASFKDRIQDYIVLNNEKEIDSPYLVAIVEGGIIYKYEP